MQQQEQRKKKSQRNLGERRGQNRKLTPLNSVGLIFGLGYDDLCIRVRRSFGSFRQLRRRQFKLILEHLLVGFNGLNRARDDAG